MKRATPKRATKPKRPRRIRRRKTKPEVKVAVSAPVEEKVATSWSLGRLAEIAVGSVSSVLSLVTPKSKNRKRAAKKVDTEGATKPVTVRFGRRKRAATKSS
jgi:hypothetical protein